MNEKFIIGCNYWDSVSGTDMWKNWNPEEVHKDLIALSDSGVKVLRVFPLWRDFQPIKLLRSFQGGYGENVFGDNELDINDYPYGLDPVMIERFKTFAKMADELGLKLFVSIVTGWMSGRLFVPPALERKNHIVDAESIAWMIKFVKGIVKEFKDIDNIIMWDLGNECNCLGKASDRFSAYNWTAIVSDAIRSIDNTRPIASGMHGLSENSEWRISDQGELCDYMTTHPYPSASIGADVEPYNSLKASMLPTAQSVFYSSLGKKPCMMQEVGSFSQMIGNDEMSADFLRVNVLSALGNGLKGMLWWCAMEHTHLRQAPYAWCEIERQLGLLYSDRSPKPVAREMKKMSKLVDELPDEFVSKTDAVCVLTKETEKQKLGLGAYVLAKEAGLNIEFIDEGTKVQNAKAYIVPCITGWPIMHVRTKDSILKNVYENGSTLFVSYDGGQWAEFEKIFGLRSYGVNCQEKAHVAKFDFGDINYSAQTEILIKPLTAKVLCENEEGNVVLSVNQYGKGKVYLLNMPLEKVAYNKPTALNPLLSQPLYKIYQEFAKEIINEKQFRTDNPNISITECKGSDGNDYVFAINYNDVKVDVDFLRDVKVKYQVVYGNEKIISPCDGLILKLLKQ